ncbi:hypothetical protein [Cellulomonas sp. HZM]|uniref:hypothetical protein n=1 Tax=Cellulomonas sp. HZM TaxID=1454010 RepID=UPI000493B480|nr:hypothetical protein [Cellulomonas sp. HZM]
MARRSAEHTAWSALPDAPVADDHRRPRVVRTRSLVAHALERLAAAIEPAPRPARDVVTRTGQVLGGPVA